MLRRRGAEFLRPCAADCGISTRALGGWRQDSSKSSSYTCILPAHPPAPQACGGQQHSDQVWQLLASYFPDRLASPPRCISIATACKADRVSTQLAAEGFDVRPLLLRGTAPGGAVVGRGSSRCCLAEALSGAPAAAEAAQRPWAGADVMCFADVMHLLDTRRALQAAHRHLRRQGLLLVLWTDRDLASQFVLDLEELLEATVPGYCRYDCQRDPSDWVSRLQMGGLFRMIDYSSFPHAQHLHGVHGLMDSMDACGVLHAALGSTGRRAFHAELQRLVTSHFGPHAHPTDGGGHSGGGSGSEQHHAHRQHRIELPLHTKAYVLARSAAPSSLLGPHGRLEQSAGAAAAGPFGPEKVCLFCGIAVAD